MIWVYVGIVVIIFIGYLITKNTVKGKLMLAFQNRDFDAYYKLLDRTITKIMIPAYNIEYMRLNGLIEEKKSKKVDDQFALLFKGRKTEKQKENLYQKCLQYYVDVNQSKKCHQVLKSMKDNQLNEKIIEEATWIVDILVDHQANHIQDIQSQLNTATKEQKVVYYYLLKSQYLNKQDNAMAMKYERLLKDLYFEINEQ